MENKHNRQSSVPPKGTVSESRKDPSNNQKNRPQRRFESSRNDRASTSRKFTLQKSNYDKRSKPRGYQNDKCRDEVNRGSKAELGSAIRPGSKKGSLNHLLNFTFAPRNSEGIQAGGHPRNRYSSRTTGTGFNKEKFLQANCQFIVNEGIDYEKYTADPDSLVDWSFIEQVRIFSHEVPSCPICLYPPTAAKMTRCGHIYCYSCILHYLSLGDKAWRKCPICYEYIYKKDLKSVISLETHQFAVGEEIRMILMKRERGTTYAMPCTQWTKRNGKPHSIHDDVDLNYAKLLVASIDDTKSMIEIERSALTRLLKEEDGSLEGSFIQAALELVTKREQDLDIMTQSNLLCSAEKETEELVCHDSVEVLGAEGGEIDVSESTEPKSNNQLTDTYFFYQAEDGQHLFLHSINARCLLKEYGSWENCPNTITATILEIDGFSMTEELRKRLKYLNHLPLACEFQVLELCLKPPLISKDTQKQFAEEIDKRHRSRQKKHREERRRSKKIQEVEERQMGIYPAMRISIESEQHFPDAESMSPPSASTSPHSIFNTTCFNVNTPEFTVGSPDSAEILDEKVSMSFAQMLKAGKAKAGEVWPKPIKEERKCEDEVKHADSDDSENEDRVPVPVFQSSFGDAIEQALNKCQIDSVNTERIEGKKSKKKKKPRQLLFTTSMQRQ